MIVLQYIAQQQGVSWHPVKKCTYSWTNRKKQNLEIFFLRQAY